MKKFCILRNTEKDPFGIFAGEIAGILQQFSAEAFITEDGSNAPSGTECIIVLGGDGTVLRAARKAAGQGIPLIGINLGSLGYLAEIPRDDAAPALEKLVNGAFRIEERMMLSGRILRDGRVVREGIALNDIVISRKGPLRIMRFENYVNDEALSVFNADGIITATPTGSTGYSLSAGGPIVSPSASLILMTPIASHLLNMRSIIFSDQDVVQIVIGEDRRAEKEAAAVTFDGEDELSLRCGDAVEIRKAKESTRFLRIETISFLETLRHKMQMV